MQSASIKLRRRIRWSTVSFFFLSGIVTATWASRIPEIQQKFHLSDSRWGAVLFAMTLGVVGSLPLSGWAIAKFTSAKVMTVSGVIYTLLLLTLSTTNQVWLLAVLLFCFGFSRGFYTMAVNTNSIEVQKLYEQPIVASFHGAWSLACLVAAGIGTYMISHNVTPAIHFVSISIIVALLLIINRRGGNKRDSQSERKPFLVKPDKYLFILGLIGICTTMCEGTIFDWSITYFQKVVEADKSMVTVGYTAFITTMTLGRLVGDNIIPYLGLQRVLLVSGLVMAGGFLIVVLFPFVWIAGFGFLLIGLGDSIIIPTLYSLAAKSKHMKPAYAITTVSMIGYIGFLTGPLIVGSISEAWGMSSAFSLMAMLCLLIFVLAIVLGRTRSSTA